jgi:hypothetical protein
MRMDRQGWVGFLFLKKARKENKSGRSRTRVKSVETETKRENNREEKSSALKEVKVLRWP